MNTVSIRIVAVSLLLLCNTFIALSQERDTEGANQQGQAISSSGERIDAEAALITDIRIEGLKRTDPSVVFRAVNTARGTEYTEAVRTKIRRDLRRLGLFDRVEIAPDPSEVSGENVVITVIVRERWTLVPLPFFTTTSGGTSGGLFVIENNLFGYNKQLITGGAFGTAGFNGIFVYRDPAILGSRYLGESSFSFGRSMDEAIDLNDETIAEWEATTTTGRLGFGYRFGDLITARTFLAFQQERFVDGHRGLGAEETEAAIYHGASVGISDETPTRYFEAGYRLELEGEYELTAENDREWKLTAEFSQDFLVFRDHRFRYALRAEESDRVFWRTTRLGGTETQRSVDRGSVPTERYASAGLAYELPVYRPDWGTFTVLGFYEGGVLVDEEDYYHGTGAGFRMYVSRVTLPALGFDLAYRLSEDVVLFSLSIGLSM